LRKHWACCTNHCNWPPCKTVLESSLTRWLANAEGRVRSHIQHLKNGFSSFKVRKFSQNEQMKSERIKTTACHTTPLTVVCHRCTTDVSKVSVQFVYWIQQLHRISNCSISHLVLQKLPFISSPYTSGPNYQAHSCTVRDISAKFGCRQDATESAAATNCRNTFNETRNKRF